VLILNQYINRFIIIKIDRGGEMTSKPLRLQKGLTQQELAKMVGISVSAVSKIENGHFVPSLRVAMKIARILGTSVEKLFCRVRIPVGKKIKGQSVPLVWRRM